MKRFILKVNSSETSKVLPCSISFMLTLTWGIDILFEKLTPETRGWILKKRPLHYDSGEGFYVKLWLVWRQVNRLGVGGNYVCCLFILAIFMGLGGPKT